MLYYYRKRITQLNSFNKKNKPVFQTEHSFFENSHTPLNIKFLI